MGPDEASFSESRFSLVFRLCPVALALIAEDGTIQDANPALCSLVGLQPGELTGHRMVDFTHPEDKEQALALAKEVASGDLALAKLEKRLVDCRGEPVPVRVTIILLDEDDGTPRKLTQIEDLSEQRHTEDHLRRQAHEDPLTGLPNRRALKDHMEPLLDDPEPELAAQPTAEAPPPRDAAQRSEAHPGPVWSVLFVDLDDFKDVNDVYGHRIGDEVLVAVARRLANVTRDADLVARLGGDEFVLLLRTGSAAEVEQAQARVRSSLSRPIQVEGHTIHVSASIGSAVPRIDDSAEQLLDRADGDMYRDKLKRQRTLPDGAS